MKRHQERTYGGVTPGVAVESLEAVTTKNETQRMYSATEVMRYTIETEARVMDAGL
jgi:hypothetical protein